MRCAGIVAITVAVAACHEGPTHESRPAQVIVSAGATHTCATNGFGTWCWGSNFYGQLGNGSKDTVAHVTPIPVTGALGFKTISAGDANTCALTENGTAYCWGYGGYGANGTGDTLSRLTPTAVAGGHQFATISVGASHVCALKQSGNAWCWGWGTYGQLGNSANTSSSVPVAVAGGVSFSRLSAGETHTCAAAFIQAYCWGYNAHGALGSGQPTGSSNVPAAVSGNRLFATASAGFRYSCGITTTGGAFCWGLNWTGELGADTPNSCLGFSDDFLPCSLVPLAVPTVAMSSIAVNKFHTCALTPAGDAYCWGSNGAGQLGDGATAQQRQTPAKVSGELAFEIITVGGSHTCGVTTSSAIYCWGSNYAGQLGTGDRNNRTTPVQISLP